MPAVIASAKPLNANLADESRDSLSDNAGSSTRWLLIAVWLGIVARIVLSGMSIGTNDTSAWREFGQAINQNGLANSYRDMSSGWLLLNHPPIPLIWADFACWATAGHGKRWLFPFVFRIPAILADAASCWILFRIGFVSQPNNTDEVRQRRGLMLAVAMAWSFDAMLISGFHGNTDSIYAMLSLLAAWLIIDRDAPLLGGIAMAAALNIKLMPLVILPPMFAVCRTRMRALRFTGGLLVGVLPYAMTFAFAGMPFIRNVFGYTPTGAKWGLPFVVTLAGKWIHHEQPMAAFLQHYRRFGSAIVLAGMTLLTLLFRSLVRDRRGAYGLVGMGYAWVLILAPGFGVQYTAMIVPLLIAFDVRLAWLYSLLAAWFAGAIYCHFCDWNWPLYSPFKDIYPDSASVPGLLAWVTLICSLVRIVKLSFRLPNSITPQVPTLADK